MTEREKSTWLPWASTPLLNSDLDDSLDHQLYGYAVTQGLCLYREGWPNAAMDEAREKLLMQVDAMWAKRGGRRVLQSGPMYTIWAGPDGTMLWSAGDFQMASFNPDFMRTMRKAFEATVTPETPPDVRVLERDRGGGYYFDEMKVPSSPFIASNYNAKIAAQFETIREGFTSPDPAGRLALLSGEPGTGKSHFVRGLLEETREKCAFCLVPPHMLTSLDGPDLVGSLRELHEPQRRGHRRRHIFTSPDIKTIVLVLEDADSCLVPRGADNMSTIAALLNMSDGIFGAALDLRIIATTNAKKVEIDPAIERPGRLLTHVLFERLLPREANVVLERLGAPARYVSTQKPVSLAEVYAAARGADK